jgi:cation diffusion facilitator family transporter
MSRSHHDHGDDHPHPHVHDGHAHNGHLQVHEHRHERHRWWRPHSHDHGASFDDETMADREGRRALVISLVGLLVAAAGQAAVTAASGSVGLLADTVHNFADALTAVPISLAFWAARRPATRRYTYGYGRAEDLAGLTVLVVMTASAAVAAWQSIDRLIHPRAVEHLPWVALAGVIGFVANELAANYRIRVGKRIGSAALVADGHHARTDGFTSLAVVVGAIGVALGWREADAVVGLLITVAIVAVLVGAARDVQRRLMDAVDPAVVDEIERRTLAVDGILGCDGVRVRWVGHALHAELNVTVDADLSVADAHQLTEVVRHGLLHGVPRLTGITVHMNPPGDSAHALTAHHLV